RVGAAERKGLLAEHLFSRARRRYHLSAMQRMRGREQDRVDGGINEAALQAAAELDPAFGTKVPCALEIGLDRAGDLQAGARLCGLDETAAPASEASDRATDHREAPDHGPKAPLAAGLSTSRPGISTDALHRVGSVK